MANFNHYENTAHEVVDQNECRKIILTELGR